MPLYQVLRPLLFRCDPERAHGLGMGALRLAQAVPGGAPLLAGRYRVADPALRQTLLGRRIDNPVGLAAGFDKNALAVAGWAALGFGFAEVGTVTPLPQAGNPRPRLFRHPRQRSLQNALGFNNRGLAALHDRLRALSRRRPEEPEHPEAVLPGGGRQDAGRPEAGRRDPGLYPLPLGVNVGKGRDTPPAAALDEYTRLLGGLGDLADYLVVNLSSPNTPGLRDLQNESFVRDLMQAARSVTRTPVLVKLSPDLPPPALEALAAAAVEAGAAGIVATNTTTDYALLPGAKPGGGLSGQVLREKSRAAAALLGRSLRGSGAVLVSVGGVDSGEEAYRRLRAGASLVQIYTALVYEGPALARRINRELLALLARDGFTHISQAVSTGLTG